MPGTRRGGKAASGGAATSDGKSQAEQPVGESADIEVIDQHGDMEESCPKDLQDAAVPRLRASVTASRKLIDDIMVEVNDQVSITNGERRDLQSCANSV